VNTSTDTVCSGAVVSGTALQTGMLQFKF